MDSGGVGAHRLDQPRRKRHQQSHGGDDHQQSDRTHRDIQTSSEALHPTDNCRAEKAAETPETANQGDSARSIRPGKITGGNRPEYGNRAIRPVAEPRVHARYYARHALRAAHCVLGPATRGKSLESISH